MFEVINQAKRLHGRQSRGMNSPVCYRIPCNVVTGIVPATSFMQAYQDAVLANAYVGKDIWHRDNTQVNGVGKVILVQTPAGDYPVFEPDRRYFPSFRGGGKSVDPVKPAVEAAGVEVTPEVRQSSMKDYYVEEPSSNDEIVVYNSGKGVGLLRGTAAKTVGTVGGALVDLAFEGGKHMAKKAATRGVEYVVNRIRGGKKQTVAKKGKSGGTKQQQAIVAAPRAPPRAPYVTTTAPVSYGATLGGSRTISRRTKSGHIVVGREFLGAAYDTKAVTSWSMALGAPLTPVSFVDSMLRQYGAMYNYFRWRKLRVHYVTTSPTSTAGSIMLYYNKDRASTYINQTSANLMPFVLSDPHTTISPQWQNFSVDLECDSAWKRLDYGLTDDSTHYCAGEVFLLSKTAANSDSPGMLLMEYEIEFKDENLTPRLLQWPQPTINYVPYTFAIPVSTAGNAVTMLLASTGVMGANTNYVQQGGIYKVILDVSNSVLAGTTPAVTSTSLFKYPTGSGTTNANLVDGTTLYAVNGPSNVEFFTNLSDAYVNNSPVQWQTTITATVSTAVLFTWFSLVGYVGNAATNPNM